MLDADEERFLKILNGLGALKKIELNEDAIELWWAAFASWSIEDFSAAANHLILTKQWIGPQDFEALRKAGKPTAGERWAEVLQFTSSGGYRERSFGDELTEKCVAMLGGWRVIGQCELGRLGFLERRFVENFEHIGDVIETRKALAAVVGLLA